MIRSIFKYIFIPIVLLNLIFPEELTESQLNEIKKITEDVNKAPDFKLNSIHQDKDSLYILSEMKDKVILINFWATWCGPCRLEIPDFNDMYKKYHQLDFEIVGISISDTKDQLENFLKSYKIDYPILYGSATYMEKVVLEYGGVYSIPMSFLIGKNNEILRVYPGAILKQYDPHMYADLIYNIENALNKYSPSEHIPDNNNIEKDIIKSQGN